MTNPAQRQRFTMAASGVLVALAILCTPLQATVARAVSFDEKVDKADAIVMGRCIRTQSQYDATHRWIITRSTFTVEKAWKGISGGELTVITPGGAVDGLHQESVGVPRFGEGDQRVLFVKQTKIGPTILYFDQGVYAVSKDERGQLEIAPASSGLVIVDNTGKARDRDDTPHSFAAFDKLVASRVSQHSNPYGLAASSASLRPEESKKAVSFFMTFVRENRLGLILGAIFIALGIVVILRLR